MRIVSWCDNQPIARLSSSLSLWGSCEVSGYLCLASPYPGARKNAPEGFSHASLSPFPEASWALGHASAPRLRVSGFGFSPGSFPVSGARAICSYTRWQWHVGSRRKDAKQSPATCTPIFSPILPFRFTRSWYHLLNTSVIRGYGLSSTLFILRDRFWKLSLWWRHKYQMDKSSSG